jgi:hypothetical protein
MEGASGEAEEAVVPVVGASVEGASVEGASVVLVVGVSVVPVVGVSVPVVGASVPVVGVSVPVVEFAVVVSMFASVDEVSAVVSLPQATTENSITRAKARDMIRHRFCLLFMSVSPWCFLFEDA